MNNNYNEDKNKIVNNYEKNIEKLNSGYKESKDKFISMLNEREKDINNKVVTNIVSL